MRPIHYSTQIFYEQEHAANRSRYEKVMISNRALIYATRCHIQSALTRSYRDLDKITTRAGGLSVQKDT